MARSYTMQRIKLLNRVKFCTVTDTQNTVSKACVYSTHHFLYDGLWNGCLQLVLHLVLHYEQEQTQQLVRQTDRQTDTHTHTAD